MSEYLCDWSDCPNVAVEVLGVVRSLRMRAAVCAEHAALIENRRNKGYDRFDPPSFGIRTYRSRAGLGPKLGTSL